MGSASSRYCEAPPASNVLLAIGGVLLFGVAAVCLGGFFVVNPNEGRVLTLFGKYVGTANVPGLWWVNPFMAKKKVSLRIRNFETGKLKVNDANSNPIEIAAIVVWKVVDTAEAMFEVDDYEHYVKVQSESAVRTLASTYPYDAHTHGEEALSTHTAEVSKRLLAEVQERLGKAGVLVTEARISHLAYAPEIASAMLQRQQASAIIAARQKIVEGAVGHGRDGARHALVEEDPGAGRRAEGEHGEQPARGPVLRARHPARREHRHPVPVASWPSARRSCSGSTRPSTRRCSAGRKTTCAA